MIDLNAVMDNVLAWVEPIGRMQLEGLQKGDLNIATKSQTVDLVTAYDIKSEQMLIERISEHYPEHAILGEEGGERGAASDYKWVLDPIDGTTNYAHGFPFFGISVALKYRGESILGVLHAPMLQQTFSAIKGEGAKLNGQPIHVSSTNKILKSIIATGFPYSRQTNNMNIAYFLKVVNKVSGIRRCGSAALDLCMVAAGMIDGYWEFQINEWDVAAGEIIIREAGGTFEQIEIGDNLMTLATNGIIYSELKNCLFEEL